MSYYSRISKAFINAPVLKINSDSRYVLISDCHRGNGTANDNFLRNQNLYFAAIQHYYRNNFTYIELGDGDELWENRSMEQILEIHSNIFWFLNKYYKKKRLYMLYGNHDIVKKNKHYIKKDISKAYINHPYLSDPEYLSMLTEIEFYSGLILFDNKSKKEICLTHGHQANLLDSVFWRLARFLVRYFWKPLELAGINDPTSAAKNNTQKKRTEMRLTNWAISEDKLLITGHTHRPMLGNIDSPYFNTGSCVHPRCITAIEIQHRCFYLVKWTLNIHSDRTLYVGREVLAPPVCIDEYSQNKYTNLLTHPNFTN